MSVEGDAVTTAAERTVLAPVRILEGESLPGGVIEFLAPVPIVVLGYYVVPDQTPPGQARIQFERQAEAALDDIATEIEAAGGVVETRLVFTDDREQTFDRVAAETDCNAILLGNPAARIDRVLVALRSSVNAERIVGVLAPLVADRGIEVTLYHAAETEAAVDEGRTLLSDVADRLVDAGVAAAAIDEAVDVTDAPVDGIVAAATDHDAVVMGESEPTLATFALGDLSDRVADRSLQPVLVVEGGRD